MAEPKPILPTLEGEDKTAAAMDSSPHQPLSQNQIDNTHKELAHVDLEKIYHGRDGYNRMVGEIRASLYHDIPEARGHIEIVNHLTPAHEEAERLQHSLGIDSATFTGKMGMTVDGNDLEAGHAHPAHLDDGRYVCIASAWDPDKSDDVDKMNFDDIKGHARIISHEAMHCLDPDNQSGDVKALLKQPLSISSANQPIKKSELFADVGAQALLLNNGDQPSGTVSMAMQYNITAPSSTPTPSYDNGSVLLGLAQHYDPAQPGLTNFNLNHWRETLAQAGALREQADSITIPHVIQDYYQAQVLANAEKKFVKSVIDKTSLAGDERFGQMVNQFFDDPTLKPRPDASADTKLAADTAMLARQNYHSWLKERSDILPAANRMTASYDWVKNGETGPVPVAATHDTAVTPDQAIGRAALKFQETGSDLDLFVFRTAGRRAKANDRLDETKPGDHPLEIYEALLKDPVTAARLARGESRNAVFKDLETNVQSPSPPGLK